MNKKMVAIVLATIGLAVAGIAAMLVANARNTGADSGRENDAASGIGTPGAEVASSVAPPTAPLPSSASQPMAPVMVEIQGAVAAPGVYSFPGDARVLDAIEKSGGTLESAEIRDINIAAVLVDGSVLSIPYRQQSGRVPLPGASDLNPPNYTRSGWAEPSPVTGPGATVPGGSTPATPAKVNINTATQVELETLPGVGEKTAEKIMRFRETQPFTQVDDLQYVQGIGEKRMEALRPHVTVE